MTVTDYGRWPTVLAAAGLIAAFVTPAAAQEDYEWNPREGLHEQEWYDPGDWFDGNGEVEYDYDWWDYGYTYPYRPYGYRYPGYYPYRYDYDRGRDRDYDVFGYDLDLDWDLDWWNEDEGRTRWQTGQRAQIYGEIEDLRLIRDDQFDEPQMGAIVETEAGVLRRVVFGPLDRVRHLDIEVGDEVNVIGRVQNVGGSPVLVASQFSTDDFRRWIHVQRTSRPLKWYHGEVLDARAVQFQGREERHGVHPKYGGALPLGHLYYRACWIVQVHCTEAEL